MAYIGPAPNPGQNREVDDISSSFNGSTTAFTLQVASQNVSPGSVNAIIVSLGGVIQNPGTDYTVAASTLTFTTAPANGLSFFGLVLGQQIDTEGSADDSIGALQLQSNAVTTAKIADDAVTFAKMQNTANGVRFLGKHDSGGGEIGEITAAQARTMLNVADGATAGGGKLLANYLATSTSEFSSSSGSFQSAHSITFTPASTSSKFLIIYMPARVITNGSSDNEIRFTDGTNNSNQYRIAAGGSVYKSPTLVFFHNHTRSGSTTFTAKYRNISGNSDTFLLGDNGSGTSLLVLEIEQ